MSEPEQFFAHSLDLLAITDFAGRFRHANPAWERQLGLSPAALNARLFLDFLHPDDRAAAAAALRRLATGGEPGAMEHRFRAASGRYHWLRWSATARRDEQLLYLVARDTSGYRQADQARQQAAAQQAALHAIDREILAARSPRAMAHAALAGLRRLLALQRGSVAMFDWKRGTANLLAVDTPVSTELGEGDVIPLSAFASLPGLQAGTPEHVPDLAALVEPSASDRHLLAEGVRAQLSVPLRAGGDLLGALNLGAAAPGGFAAEAVALAEQVAELLSLALQQSRRSEEVRRQLDELAGLHEQTAGIGTLADVVQTHGRLAERMCRLIGARLGVIMLREADDMVRAQAPGYGLTEAEVAALQWPGREHGADAAPPESTEVYRLDAFPPSIASRLAAVGMDDALLAPLWTERQRQGYVVVSGKPGGFGPADRRLLGVFASQAAVVIQNAQLFARVQQHAAETDALLASTESLGASLDSDTALKEIASQARALLNVDGCCLYLLEAASQTLRCVTAEHPHGAALLGQRVRMGEGLVGLAAASGQAQTALSDAGEPLPGAPPGPEALAAMPLNTPNSTLGVMLATRPGHANPFTSADLRLMAAFAQHGALAIERARLYENEHSAREHAEVLLAAGLALTQSLDLDVVLAELLRRLRQVVPYDSASIMIVNPGESRVAVYAERGYQSFTGPTTVRGLTFDVQSSANLRRVINDQVSVVIPDTAEDPEWVVVKGGEHIRNWLGVPLLAGGRVIGLYSLDKAEPHFFTAEHRRVAESLAGPAAVAIQNARLFEQVRQGREQLQALSRRLVETQEVERRALARELHDEIGQTLTALKLALGMLPRLPPESVHQRAAEAAGLVNGLLDRVQALSLDLRPAMLDDLGLTPALLWLFERYSAQTGVSVLHEFVGLRGRLPPEVETTAYRVVQEALTNVARHAGVPEARVRVLVEDDWLRLQVQDEGRGLDPAEVLASGQRAGLAGMHERVALLNGRLVVDSAPGAGTLIAAVLPLTPRRVTQDEHHDPPGG